jgi:hypothetical protein
MSFFHTIYKDIFKSYKSDLILYFVISTSLYINYMLRTSEYRVRKNLLGYYHGNLKLLASNHDFYYAWNFFSKKIFDELSESDADFNRDIAIIEPLKENLIAMMVCFASKIPIVICGKPGTSKTLSTEILRSRIGHGDRTKGILGRFPKMDSNYYCGSQNSTSEEIEKVFRDTENRMRELKKLEGGGDADFLDEE